MGKLRFTICKFGFKINVLGEEYMTIYNLNLGIGWASSGVEYAQVYRANIFKKLQEPAKFVFMDMIQAENIAHLTRNIGFEDSDVIWLYTHFTDVKIAPTTYTLSDIKKSMGLPVSNEENMGKSIRLDYSDQDMFVTCYLTNEASDTVDRAEFVSRGNLVRKDFYNYTRMYSEYYTPRDNRAYLYQRNFFNEDGTVAYEEIIDGTSSIYKFKDQIFMSKEAFIGYFLDTLNLTRKDILIVDRETGLGQAVLEHKGEAQTAVVIHAEHFSPTEVYNDTILWNNYYDYQFTNADAFKHFITATEVQKSVLVEQLQKYTNVSPRIHSIPVGSIDILQKTRKKRRPFSLITASRLAGEKHIDWLVMAVAQAQKVLPELSLDIYGQGGEQEKLKELIKELGAEDYIHLMGHEDLTEVYKNYECYIAASTSEGFGLSLLEAIGSGLPIIGLDVRYGNQTFVDNNKNGYLLPRKSPDNAQEMAKDFAEKIIQMHTEVDLAKWRKHSYEKAKPYLTTNVGKLWKAFIEEVTHD